MNADAVETVAILCGGRGTRLREHTQAIPKGLVEVGARPILWHIVQIYAAQGFGRVVLCTGYKGELIDEFVAAESWPAGVAVTCVDTGPGHADRRPPAPGTRPPGTGTFCATYGDGVADIDLARLLRFHRDHGALAHDDGRAARAAVRRRRARRRRARDRAFTRSRRSEHWINGGFFCFEPASLDHLGDDSVLEREPLERLAADGQLRAFRHEGFWDCMDTYKDAVLLNDLWERGRRALEVWA